MPIQPSHLRNDPSSVILKNHNRFLAFIRSRVGSQEAAEELLQEAYLKAIKRSDSIRDNEKIVSWFYRILRNALIDYYRRRGAEAKAMDRLRSDPIVLREDPAFEKAVCQCVNHVIKTLKPEYSDILKKAELEDESLKDIAQISGMTQGHAAVRLHRARQSLKKNLLKTCGACAAHGCIDCNCRRS